MSINGAPVTNRPHHWAWVSPLYVSGAGDILAPTRGLIAPTSATASRANASAAARQAIARRRPPGVPLGPTMEDSSKEGRDERVGRGHGFPSTRAGLRSWPLSSTWPTRLTRGCHTRPG